MLSSAKGAFINNKIKYIHYICCCFFNSYLTKPVMQVRQSDDSVLVLTRMEFSVALPLFA